jgi:hypothetical protein
MKPNSEEELKPSIAKIDGKYKAEKPSLLSDCCRSYQRYLLSLFLDR